MTDQPRPNELRGTNEPDRSGILIGYLLMALSGFVVGFTLGLFL